MAHQTTLYPFEFFIAGTPLSLQASSKSKERWKTAVGDAARERARQTDEVGILDRNPLAVIIYYFATAPMRGDVDNIVKPILDALLNVAYLDDRDVERVLVQKFEPQFARSFADPTEQLAAALNTAPPVVYLRVYNDLSWRRLS